MKSITIDDDIYNKMRKLAREKNTTLVTVLRAEMPAIIDKMKTTEYAQLKTKSKAAPPPPEEPKELALPRQTLMNMVYTLVELDPDAPENQAQLEATLAALGKKVENYCIADSLADSQIEAIKKEIDYLRYQVSRFELAQERMRTYAMAAMKTLGVEKIQGEYGYRMSIQKSEAVDVYDSTLLPDWALNKEIKITANKTAIREALKSKEKVEGAKMKESEYVRFDRKRNLASN
jgi:hypothetical protein